MTKAEELLGLADRLEREEPSRELSAAIAFASGWRLKQAIWWKPAGSHEWSLREPDFTTSLDSAVTLVPKGCGWQVSVNKHRCEVMIGHPSRFAETGRAIAKTPAAALTAAALRARASLLTDGAEKVRT